MCGPTGLRNLSIGDGEATFTGRYNVLQQLNAGGIRRSDFEEMAEFYAGARAMMYDPTVTATFRFTSDDQLKYGNSGFGNACIVARNRSEEHTSELQSHHDIVCRLLLEKKKDI